MKGENDMLDLDAKAIDLDDLIFHTEQKQEKKIDPNISPEGKKEQKPEKIKTKMICNKMEILLVLAGPIFMKVVRRA